MWKPINYIFLVIFALLFGVRTGVMAQDLRQKPEDIPAWIMPTDHPEKSTIIRLDPLSKEFKFEFWVAGDTSTLTKEQLVQAIEWCKGKRIEAKVTCILGPNGEVLNYPCRVHNKPAIAKKKRG